ncbi:hypothetical protein ACWEPL_42320, partial [Nonomuraea sp. NPDC004186]
MRLTRARFPEGPPEARPFALLSPERTATPDGGRARITIRHVLRNSVGTAVVAVGLQVGNLLAGAV